MQMKKQVDLVIEARWLCPIVPKNTLLEFQSVVIQSGKIVDICAISSASELYQANEIE